SEEIGVELVGGIEAHEREGAGAVVGFKEGVGNLGLVDVGVGVGTGVGGRIKVEDGVGGVHAVGIADEGQGCAEGFEAWAVHEDVGREEGTGGGDLDGVNGFDEVGQVKAGADQGHGGVVKNGQGAEGGAGPLDIPGVVSPTEGGLGREPPVAGVVNEQRIV